MPSNVKLNTTPRIIQVAYSGFVSTDELETCAAKAIAIHLEKNVNEVLIDTTELESFANFFDVYDRPKHYAEANVSRSLRVAVVSPRSTRAQEFIRFYDNVCNNRGWTVKQFQSRDEAVEWLAVNESPSTVDD